MQIKLFIKGLIIGIGKIIPGVSGALFAMIFGVYELLLECISNPKVILKKFNMVFPLSIGIITSIIFCSNIIKLLLDNYYIESMALFLGLMSYGIIEQIKICKKEIIKLRDILYGLIISSLLFSFFLIDFKNGSIIIESGFHRIISLFLCGLIDAASTIIPGISGTAILMLLGYYELIIASISTINITVLLPFLLGLLIGIMLLSKVISYLFKTKRNIMNTSIIFFTLYSIIALLVNLIIKVNIKIVLPAITFFLIGLYIGYITEEKVK